MSKISSYQKLMAKNKELQKEIFTLVAESDSFEAMEIRSRYSMIYDFSRAMLFGSNQKRNRL